MQEAGQTKSDGSGNGTCGLVAKRRVTARGSTRRDASGGVSARLASRNPWRAIVLMSSQGEKSPRPFLFELRQTRSFSGAPDRTASQWSINCWLQITAQIATVSPFEQRRVRWSLHTVHGNHRYEPRSEIAHEHRPLKQQLESEPRSRRLLSSAFRPGIHRSGSARASTYPRIHADQPCVFRAAAECCRCSRG